MHRLRQLSRAQQQVAAVETVRRPAHIDLEQLAAVAVVLNVGRQSHAVRDDGGVGLAGQHEPK